MDIDRIIDELDIAVKKYPMKALAPEIGKRYGTLANEFSDQPGYKLGFITVLQILEMTKDLTALDMIEESFGRVPIVIPKPEKGKMTEIMHLVSRMSKKFGESIKSLADAIQDGVITKNKAEMCLKENMRLIKVALELEAYLEQFVDTKRSADE